MSSAGKIFVVGSMQQIRILIPLAQKSNAIVISVKAVGDIKTTKVKRIDILPGNIMGSGLAAYCRIKKIQVFRWTDSQWNKLLEGSKEGGD